MICHGYYIWIRNWSHMILYHYILIGFLDFHCIPKASGINVSVSKPWNVLPFSKVKTTHTFTWCWSIHLLTAEVSERKLKRSRLDSLCKQTSQNNRAKLSETFCILGFELQNAAQQFSLRQQCPNVVGLSKNFWSAPHWAVQATLSFKFSIFTKITNHTVGGVGLAVLLPMLSLLLLVFLW